MAAPAAAEAAKVTACTGQDRPVLTVLIGAAGSGKSTAAREGWPGEEVVSVDGLRQQVSGDENDQAATPAALAAMEAIVRDRLADGRNALVDATNAEPRDRSLLVNIARDCGAMTLAVVMCTPEEICLARNAARPGPVPDAAVRRQHRQIHESVPGLRGEGFDVVRCWHPAAIRAAGARCALTEPATGR